MMFNRKRRLRASRPPRGRTGAHAGVPTMGKPAAGEPRAARGTRTAQGSGAARPRRRGGITRRRFALGSIAAAGAGMAAIALNSCSFDEESSDGDPQVVTDSSLITAVLDGDFEYSDDTPTLSASWELPLGTLLFHSGGCSWAAAMLAPESASTVNTLGIVSLESGTVTTLVETPSFGSTYSVFDVRCTDSVYAWVEINYNDLSWALLGQQLSSGALTGDPVVLDEGDEDWEPPRFTTWSSSVIWQKMPMASGGSSSEASHCYIWSVGSAEGTEIKESPGRFATSPRVADGVLTIAPRVRADEGVYYGMTAIDLSSETFDQIDQLVLPSSVSPFDATYMNDVFVFSIEAAYDNVGSLGNMGTFLGSEGGPYLYVRREPVAQVTSNGAYYLIKSQASHIIVDTDAQMYGTLFAPDRCLDYGDYPATDGISSQFVCYATVRDDTGLPDHVLVRVFSI